MLGKVVSQALNDLEQVRLLLIGFQSLREKTPIPHEGIDVPALNGVSVGSLKLFEYCTAIIRIYTVFERLIYSLAEAWIIWVLKHNAPTILASPRCRIAYEIGLAEIFRRQTETRFVDMDRFELAQSHGLFDPTIKTQGSNSLTISPFVATFPNLRMEQVNTLFTSIELGSPNQWLDKSVSLLRLRDEYSLSYSEALKDVVQRRNEVAHGNPDPGQTLGTNELLARIDVVSNLVISLHQYLLSAASKLELGEDFEKGLVGKITHYWPSSGAAELTLTSSAIGVGEDLLIIDGSACFLSTIESIQLEGQNTMGFSGQPGTKLGVKMNHLPKTGALLLRTAPIRDLPSLMI